MEQRAEHLLLHASLQPMDPLQLTLSSTFCLLPVHVWEWVCVPFSSYAMLNLLTLCCIWKRCHPSLLMLPVDVRCWGGERAKERGGESEWCMVGAYWTSYYIHQLHFNHGCTAVLELINHFCPCMRQNMRETSMHTSRSTSTQIHSVCIYLKHMIKHVLTSANVHAICKFSVLMCMQTITHAHGVATEQQIAAESLFRLSVYQHPREHTEITGYLPA